MPPDPGPTAGAVFDKRLLTMPTLLWHHDHNLVHLLDRQQPAAGPPVSGLAAPLPSGGRRLRARRGLGRIRRGGTGRIGGVLSESGFQLADPLLQDGILRAQRGVLPPERCQLLQQGCWVQSPYRPRRLDHAAVVARRRSWCKPTAAAPEGGRERLHQKNDLYDFVDERVDRGVLPIHDGDWQDRYWWLSFPVESQRAAVRFVCVGLQEVTGVAQRGFWYTLDTVATSCLEPNGGTESAPAAYLADREFRTDDF